MNTVAQTAATEEVRIEDIPLNKWLNIVIRLTKQTTLDIYVNGTLSKRHILSGVARQNYGDVYVCQNQHPNSWEGWISSLRYYDYALGTNDIMNIAEGGPNTTVCSSSMGTMVMPPYLSNRWYFAGANSMYNP